jgi:tetratricopeptide repeat protein 8
LAIQCFRLALVYNNDHAEAYNNLGLVELQRENNEIVNERFLFEYKIYFIIQGRAYLQTAQSLAPHMFEPYYNFAKSMYQVTRIIISK